MVCDEDKFKGVLKEENKGKSDEEKMADIIEACEQGFLKCDTRIRESNKIDDEDCDESGCTANLNIITGEFITCANLGDTRSVLCRSGEAVEMSHDHKPTNADETARIEKAGARVTRKRVNAAIAVSRSLGDYFFKSNVGKHPWDQPLSCKPQVVTRRRQHETDEFVVCCCDGVFDVMSNKEVTDFIRQRLTAGESSLTIISSELLNHCLKLNSKDNMTCLIVLLPPGEKLIPSKCCSIS